MRAFIEKIEIYPEKRKDGCWVRNNVFNFPVPVNGEDVVEYSLESLTTVETVVLSVRKAPDAYVRIKMDMGDFDLTKSETKATYGKIKAYVKEQTGLNVSNLDIAQTKRKSGIIERENYNHPKSADAKQPQCTKEKEEAILEALKHYQMI